MIDLVPVRRALLSVSDKTDLVPFARGLVELGVEIISTGGTARALADADVPVTSIEQLTGFPEMMDGRVKTLHPSVHGAVLALRDNDTHVKAMQEHGITPIDLVCVNLYPFERTVRQDDISEAEAIEQIDIGGPAMLRSAAKNHAFVTVITNASQYDRVINELRANEGSTTLEMRRDLAAAAFTRTAEYDTAIAAWMCERRAATFPQMLRLAYAQTSVLRYGENPHQHAALYSNPASGETGLTRANMLHGKPLSYNNINDAAAAVELIRDMNACFPTLVAAAIIKHTNPCGAALGQTGTEAFSAAYLGDPLAAYGGIAAISATVDQAACEAICGGQRFLEVIVAPSFSEQAVQMLAHRWPNVRLLALGSMERPSQPTLDYRSVPGGMLVQERDDKLPGPGSWMHAAGPQPSESMLNDGVLAMLAAKHLKSNAIAIAADSHVLGVGCGQVDRVTACQIAIQKAAARMADHSAPVAASDAFFPFDDGPRKLIDAGVRCIIHPGGSKRDQETIDLCNEREVACLITHVRHFRH